MLEGYEKYTEELNEQEKKLLPVFVRCLKAHIGSAMAISNVEMRKGLSRCGVNISGARVRKIINTIQHCYLIPRLVSSSKGYYVATERADIVRYIASVRSRANSIYKVAEAVAEHEDIDEAEIREYLQEYYGEVC